MTVMGSFAGLLFKRASAEKSPIKMIFNWNFICGGGLYFLSSLLNILVLRHLDLSVVYPLTALTYVWTLFVSYLFLKEKISLRKAAGVGCVLVGALLLSWF